MPTIVERLIQSGCFLMTERVDIGEYVQAELDSAFRSVCKDCFDRIGEVQFRDIGAREDDCASPSRWPHDRVMKDRPKHEP